MTVRRSSPEEGPEPGLRVFVQTRGTARAADYSFLGAAPPQPWWREYRDLTSFDHPTVLVTAVGDDRWSAYLSGLPSRRVDAVGTTVRYTLVLDGPCGPGDPGCLTAAVAAWLDDVADGVAGRSGGVVNRSGGRLTTVLDARFPADDVQRWLAHPDPDEAGPVADEVRRRVLAAFADLPAPVVTDPVDQPDDWFGAVTAPRCRAAFVARVAELLDGSPGRALLLNLAGGPEDAAALVLPEASLAVLVDAAEPASPTPLWPVVEGKARSPTGPPPWALPPWARTALWLGVMPLVMTALAVLLALLLFL